MAQVCVSHINKTFGAMKALNDVTLDFPDGKFFGLLGPSGSGKTTLLRTIAGFVQADSGSITIGGESVEAIPVEKRDIGMVFQSYALFPNMTVAENVAFGLKVRKESTSVVAKKVNDALELVQLGHLGARKPHELSGGQRQRVALARATVTQPRVLLLDEPLSALDKSLRVDMQIELKRIQKEIGITTIFVTHDQEEALTLSDQIGILRDGALVQAGSPREIYNNPTSEFAARFLGEANIFTGTQKGKDIQLTDGSVLSVAKEQGEQSDNCGLAIRPEHIQLHLDKPQDPAMNVLDVNLEQKVFAGAMATCLLNWQGQTIKVLAKDHELTSIPESGKVWLSWAKDQSVLVPLEQ